MKFWIFVFALCLAANLALFGIEHFQDSLIGTVIGVAAGFLITPGGAGGPPMSKQKGPYDWTWHDTLICILILLAVLLLGAGAALEAIPQ